MADEFDALDEDFGEDGTIEMIDENGESTVFELLAAFDFDGAHYLAVTDPETDDEEIEEEGLNVLFLRTETDEDGNDIYVTVEEEEADRAFEYFLTLVDGEDADSDPEA